jgi:hypothetical protein
MSSKSPLLFHEEHGFKHPRVRCLLVILPAAFLSPRERTYIASGNRGVRLTLMKGMKVPLGLQRPQELAQAIAAACGST